MTFQESSKVNKEKFCKLFYQSNKIEVKSVILDQLFNMIEKNIFRTPKVALTQNDNGNIGVEVADPSG